MMISTKGRYALRVLVDLAEHRQEGYIPLRTVAQRQGISQKYLESIMTTLSKAGYVDGTHGRGGGYRLTREPEAYHIGPILRLIEGSLAPVQCVVDAAAPCEMAGECRTR
ncbi:MAG: RrF2 family transcriptional regulator, partial [Vescimonas sp.]